VHRGINPADLTARQWLANVIYFKAWEQTALFYAAAVTRKKEEE
jgi:hypothetical protein